MFICFNVFPSSIPFYCQTYSKPISPLQLPEAYTKEGKYTKPDKRPSTTGGILIIKDGFLLIAKEQDPAKGGFSEFSGRGELKNNDLRETLIETARRELQEETGYYNLTLDKKMIYGSCYQEHLKNHREVGLFFIIPHDYKEASFLLQMASQYAKKNNSVLEKSEFVWVKISSLPSYEEVVKNPQEIYKVLIRDNHTEKELAISLRPFFLEYLKSPDFYKTLKFVGQL
jgi:ADP-ribose pyrophosphatase YjhB (NUDIX family)